MRLSSVRFSKKQRFEKGLSSGLMLVAGMTKQQVE
jgi:hypothetical protein